MAEVSRKRTLVNPARRRKRRKRNPRKMSAKQIKWFGTKAQKAALKNSRRRKRANASRRHTKRHSPARRNAAPKRARATRRAHRTTHRRRTRRRSNPGGIVEVALNPATPKRRKKTVARTRRRKRSNARRRHHTVRHRRRNPVATTRRHRRRRSYRTNRRRSRRSNPSFGGIGSLITSAAYAVGGAVSSKYLTQLVLGSSNTGYLGYAANLAASFVGGKALGMFIKNKQAENSFILGGVIMTLIRFLSDQTPLGSTLQQYGLGDYEASTWLSPARLIDANKSAQIELPALLQPRVVTRGMAGLQRGLGGGTYARGRGTY
jgi:hypothetical protein